MGVALEFEARNVDIESPVHFEDCSFLSELLSISTVVPLGGLAWEGGQAVVRVKPGGRRGFKRGTLPYVQAASLFKDVLPAKNRNQPGPSNPQMLQQQIAYCRRNLTASNVLCANLLELALKRNMEGGLAWIARVVSLNHAYFSREGRKGHQFGIIARLHQICK